MRTDSVIPSLVGVSNPLSEYLVTGDLESGNRSLLLGKYTYETPEVVTKVNFAVSIFVQWNPRHSSRKRCSAF
jgi:hypothetical protein